MSELKIYKNQETARLSEADLTFLHDCYESIANTDQRIPIGTFLMKAVERAIQHTKPLPAKVNESAEYLQIVNDLEQEKARREAAEKTVLELNEIVTERTRQLNEAGLVASNHILIDFSANPKYKEFVEGILIIARSKGWASDMSELITRIISEFQQIGYFQLTPEDEEIIRKERG